MYTIVFAEDAKKRPEGTKQESAHRSERFSFTDSSFDKREASFQFRV